MLRNLWFISAVLGVFLWTPVFSQTTAAAPKAVHVCCAELEELKIKYLKNNQYNEFVEFLHKSKDKTSQNCVNYYKAFARYAQLKYLEEKQLWDDYFTNGNTYRDQIESNAKKVISSVDNANCLRPQSRLLLWQFYFDQQSTFTQQALDDLITDSGSYAKEANDPALIKKVADKLLEYNEKPGSREIYKLYVNQLVKGRISLSELKDIGAEFYKDGNLDLAQTVYDIYIEKITKELPQDKLVPELFEIAGLFVYKAEGLFDMAYAENIYSKIEQIVPKDAFGQEEIYLRAFNLEKYKEYQKAGGLYLKLIELYPETKHYDEAVYKIAMINAYALLPAPANLAEARKYLGLLASKTVFTPQVIKSFYHLGLFAQWEGDNAIAKDYYSLLLKNAADSYPSITSQARERLKEIEENKEMEYNLKTFLDLSLKSDSSLIELGKAELKSSSYMLVKNKEFTASSLVSMPQSGCNQVQLQFLWSGDLGGADPGVEQSNFEGAYPDTGTKEVNVVIISPAGTIDRSFVMMDVY
ncbi:MAG: hypothetical protein PHR84_05465 [Candidatus Omnitrophica bacterium]|nr:hypothetical protein [Candidatus Omnitrophota bacterium]MDD5661008.1 hypothetical protein [Candidatus Omnitrophota bacterium]